MVTWTRSWKQKSSGEKLLFENLGLWRKHYKPRADVWKCHLILLPAAVICHSLMSVSACSKCLEAEFSNVLFPKWRF